MLIDTHSHLNSSPFDKDLGDVIKRCQKNNVWVINVGINYESSERAVEIAEKYNQGIFAAIGLHPDQLGEGVVKIKINDTEYIIEREKEFNYEKYEKLALSSDRVVAIGEIGLDYLYKPKTKRKLELFKQKQKDLLLQEIKLAQELNLPIIFHCRMAHDNLIEILNTLSISNDIATARTLLKGVIHCFTGNWEQAEKYLEMGFYLGFNGIVFKLNLDEIIKKTPLDRILIETDCPFLTPPNFYPEQSRRIGEERNNPLAVKIIAEHIAKIKNLPLEKIAEITSANAKKLFKI